MARGLASGGMKEIDMCRRITDREEREIQRRHEERIADPVPIGTWIRTLLTAAARYVRGRHAQRAAHLLSRRDRRLACGDCLPTPLINKQEESFEAG
jgi:hypothetical protein